MLNTGVGPTINHRPKQRAPNPMSYQRYQTYQANNHYRPPMTNLPLQTNTLNLPRGRDINNAPMMQNQLSTFKPGMNMESSVKKMESPYRTDKDIPLSPGSKGFLASRRDTEANQPNLSTTGVVENMPNLSSPAQTANENKLTSGPTMMKMSEKDLSKASELTTLSLKVGSLPFKNCKILTKIHYGKRQITWEIADIRFSPRENSKEKAPSKRKFEVLFSNIEKIDLNTVRNSLTIETKEQPQEYKEYNHTSKKAGHWFKEPNFDSESDQSDNIGPTSGHVTIQAIYPKDSLTKALTGRFSQLDKLMRSGLPLTINGKPTEVLLDAGKTGQRDDGVQAQKKTSQRPHKQSFSQMLRSGPQDDFKFPNFDLDPLQITHSESDKMPEEVPPKEDGEEEEDDDEKEFPLLNKDRKADIKKFETQIKSMKPEEKMDLILETIKPKRFGINQNSKKIYKCPIYKCSAQKSTPSLLKSHLNQKHKALVDVGFSVDDTGLFTWKPEAIDFVLMVTKNLS